MDAKFVSAVKRWVKFELFLTVVSTLGIELSGINAGKYLSAGMMMI